jgi:hypothetical protein
MAKYNFYFETEGVFGKALYLKKEWRWEGNQMTRVYHDGVGFCGQILDTILGLMVYVIGKVCVID